MLNNVVFGVKGDLSSGWDWTNRQHREKAEMAIEMSDPDLLIMSPPCCPLSRQLACTPMNKRKNPKRFCREAAEAKAMVLQVSIQADETRQALRLRIIATSDAWRQPCLQKLVDECGGHWLDVPACAVGLRDPSTHKLFGKKWSFLTNAGGIALELSKLECDGHHAHQRVEGTTQG